MNNMLILFPIGIIKHLEVQLPMATTTTVGGDYCMINLLTGTSLIHQPVTVTPG